MDPQSSSSSDALIFSVTGPLERAYEQAFLARRLDLWWLYELHQQGVPFEWYHSGYIVGPERPRPG